MSEVQGQAPNVDGQMPPPAGGHGQQDFNQGVPQYQAPQQQFQAPVVPTAAPAAPVQQPASTPLGQSLEQPKAEQQPVPQYSGTNPLDVSIDIFTKSSGVSQEAFYEAMAGALQYSDPSLINVQQLTQGLKPEQAAQAEALVKAAYHQAQETRQQTIQTAYSKAGGEQQWRQAVDAFNTKAPSYIQAAAKAMEQAGQINEAVEFILNTAQQYGLVNTQQGQSIQGSFGGSTLKGLSQQDYSAALKELAKETGSFYNIENHPKFKQLTDARLLGTQQGI